MFSMSPFSSPSRSTSITSTSSHRQQASSSDVDDNAPAFALPDPHSLPALSVDDVFAHPSNLFRSPSSDDQPSTPLDWQSRREQPTSGADGRERLPRIVAESSDDQAFASFSSGFGLEPSSSSTNPTNAGPSRADKGKGRDGGRLNDIRTPAASSTASSSHPSITSPLPPVRSYTQPILTSSPFSLISKTAPTQSSISSATTSFVSPPRLQSRASFVFSISSTSSGSPSSRIGSGGFSTRIEAFKGKLTRRKSSSQGGLRLPTRPDVGCPSIQINSYSPAAPSTSIIGTVASPSLAVMPSPAVLSPFPKSILPPPHSLSTTVSQVPLSLLSLTRPSSSSSPIPIPRNTFDTILPPELKLAVFASLLRLFLDDEALGHQQLGTPWLEDRWIGAAGGFRELIKLSRVSKVWQAMVFDGSLWSQFSIRAFSHLSPFPLGIESSNGYLVPLASLSLPIQTVLAISSRASTFVRELNLRGFCSISSATLHALALAASTSNLTPRSYDQAIPTALPGSSLSSEGFTLLTKLDLQGCRSFSTNALNHLLAVSPKLEWLNLKALGCVSNATLRILANHCPSLRSLNLSRCSNITAAGVRLLAEPPSEDYLVSTPFESPMQHLHLAGLPCIDSPFMASLARSMPKLNTLDLSSCRSLRDDHLFSFVTTLPLLKNNPSLITATSREMGRDPSSSTLYQKCITSLRHLNLSNCSRISSLSLYYLSRSVPDLRFLELAGWGHRLIDEGLVTLIGSCPWLERVDLEDATDITDGVLDAFTGIGRGKDGKVSSRLTHLNVAFAVSLTGDGMMRLLNGCPKLKVLEADNTNIPDSTLIEFLRLTSLRHTLNAHISLLDNRQISKHLLLSSYSNPLTPSRPRPGLRGYTFRPFAYQYQTFPTPAPSSSSIYEEEEEERQQPLVPGRNETTPSAPVVSSFHGWALVDRTRVELRKEKEAEERKKRRALSEGAASRLALDGRGDGTSKAERMKSGRSGRRFDGWRSGGGGGTIVLMGGGVAISGEPGSGTMQEADDDFVWGGRGGRRESCVLM